jgi:hypothetical protein
MVHLFSPLDSCIFIFASQVTTDVAVRGLHFQMWIMSSTLASDALPKTMLLNWSMLAELQGRPLCTLFSLQLIRWVIWIPVVQGLVVDALMLSMNVESKVRRWMWSLYCRHELKSWSKFWLKQVRLCVMSCRGWSVLPTKRQELGNCCKQSFSLLWT